MTTTTDEKALLSAICAEPHEDTPRLAYADWLDGAADEMRVVKDCPECHGRGHETHGWGTKTGVELCLDCGTTGVVGDPDGIAQRASLRDRAEFIRVQVELARIRADVAKNGQSVGPPAALVNGLADHERKLWAKLDLSNLPGHAHVRSVEPWVSTSVAKFTFTRGFVSGITCTAREWTADHERRANLGKCPACKGKTWVSNTCFRDREFSDFEMVTVPVDCKACSGTGRRTRGDGFAARVVLACPVAGVTLGDVEAEYTEHESMGWALVREAGNGRLRPCYLPAPLYDALRGFSRENSFGCKFYPTPNAARQALSDACVAWARAEAGLPAIEVTA